MKNESIIKKLCCMMGKDNNATYVAMSIALFKGIFRPIITLRDKKRPENERKYAAIREGLTEALAIPIYGIAGMIVPDFFKERLAENPKNIRNVKDTRSIISFISVAAATFVIPLLCNYVMPPVMKAIEKYEEGKKQKNGIADNNIQKSDISTLPVQEPSSYNPVNPSSCESYARAGMSLRGGMKV